MIENYISYYMNRKFKQYEIIKVRKKKKTYTHLKEKNLNYYYVLIHENGTYVFI
jgi:hypothetical protein